MIEREPATRDEMVLAFLRAEIDSPRFGAAYRGILARSGVRREALLDWPNLASRRDSHHRSELLRAVRGFGDNALLFEGFPDDAQWRRVELESSDMAHLRYANYPDWTRLAGTDRRVIDGAAQLHGLAEDNETRVNTLAVAEKLRTGKRYPELIAVAGGAGQLILLEGHTRATAHALVGVNAPVPVLVGSSPTMSGWRYY